MAIEFTVKDVIHNIVQNLGLCTGCQLCAIAKAKRRLEKIKN